MGKKIICSAVNILCRNNMISCLRHGLECIGHRRCAGGNCQSRHAAFQRRYSLFENIFRRICQPPVNITGILQRKPCCAVITVSEHIGSCLINRNCPRVRDRIRLFLSNMKCQCLKFQFSSVSSLIVILPLIGKTSRPAGLLRFSDAFIDVFISVLFLYF